MRITSTIKIALVLFFASLHLIVLAQNSTGKIHGKILNVEGLPAENLTVELKHASRNVVTDADGFFVFSRLPSLTDSVVVSSVDSKTFIIKIQIRDGEDLDLGIIRLTQNIKELQNVEITGRKLRSYKSDYSFMATKTETALQNLPQSVSTITKELIKDKMEFMMKDALEAASGVNQYSGYDEYTIRGFRAENAGNINGLRGYNTTYTSSMLVNMERIEIIKGPVSSLYGNGDPGGTINLVTKKPLDKAAYSIDLFGGSWNHFRAQTDLTGPLNKSKTLLYRFNAGYDNTQSFSNQYYGKSYQLAPSLSFIPNKRLQINVDFSLSHVNTVLDRGQPGFQNDFQLTSTPIKLSVTQPGDFLHETDRALIASASYKINKRLSFTTGFLNYNAHQNVANHGLKDFITEDSVNLYFTRWNYNTVTNSLSDYFTYQFATGKARHKLLFGYDYIKSKVKLDQTFYESPDQFGDGSGIVGTFSLKKPVYSSRSVSDYVLSDEDDETAGVDPSIYSTQGVYVQDYISINRWKFLIGLRREFYRGEGDDSDEEIKQDIFTYRAGIVYAVSPSLSVYTSYNTGFDPFEASGTVQVFNAPLKPIKSSLMEVGAKTNFLANKLSASLALYRLTVQNVAVNANNIANPDLFVQQGQNRSMGVETELNGNILPNLAVSFSYAYCDAKVTKSKVPDEVGKAVENAPHNLSSSWISYTVSHGTAKGFGISLGHSQASARSTLDQTIILPGYFILNAGIHYKLRNISIGALLNNVTNKTYWMAAYNNIAKWPGAPRNFMVTIGYQF